MRKIVSDLVEKSRFDGGRGIYPGEFYGHFLFRRNGSYLYAIAGPGDLSTWPLPGEPWDHVSVSVKDEIRCPTWGEMAWIKSLFFDDEETVIQFHPPRSKYVNVHEYVLHLWRPTSTMIPLPPLEAV